DREPALSLCRGTVGEGVGHNITLCLPLQAVVTDCSGGLQSCFNVARFNRIPALVGVISPNAGEAISLQLDEHLNAVRLRLAACRALSILRLWQNSEQV